MISLAPTALSNGPSIIELQGDFVVSAISRLEASNGKSLEPTREAEDEWSEMIEAMNKPTLLPLTNSWWTGANIPGKKIQMLTHLGGLKMYEEQCLEKLNDWKGFNVTYGEGGKKSDEEKACEKTATIAVR